MKDLIEQIRLAVLAARAQVVDAVALRAKENANNKILVVAGGVGHSSQGDCDPKPTTAKTSNSSKKSKNDK